MASISSSSGIAPPMCSVFHPERPKTLQDYRRGGPPEGVPPVLARDDDLAGR